MFNKYTAHTHTLCIHNNFTQLWHILNPPEEFKIIAPFKQTFNIIGMPALASSGLRGNYTMAGQPMARKPNQIWDGGSVTLYFRNIMVTRLHNLILKNFYGVKAC